MGLDQTTGRNPDRYSWPWTYSTIPGFAVVGLACVGLSVLAVACFAEAARGGEPPPYGVAFTCLVISCALAVVPILGVRRGAVGRGTVSSGGVEFRPLFGPVRRFPWDQIASVQWGRASATLRTPADELVVVWSLLPARDQPQARGWVRASLEPWFALVDAARPTQPVSYVRVLVATAVAAAPVLTAWQVLLRNPDASRLWVLVIFLPLPALYAVAVVLIRRQGRGELWYHRRPPEAVRPAMPPDPYAVL